MITLSTLPPTYQETISKGGSIGTPITTESNPHQPDLAQTPPSAPHTGEQSTPIESTTQSTPSTESTKPNAAPRKPHPLIFGFLCGSSAIASLELIFSMAGTLGVSSFYVAPSVFAAMAIFYGVLFVKYWKEGRLVGDFEKSKLKDRDEETSELSFPESATTRGVTVAAAWFFALMWTVAFAMLLVTTSMGGHVSKGIALCLGAEYILVAEEVALSAAIAWFCTMERRKAMHRRKCFGCSCGEA